VSTTALTDKHLISNYYTTYCLIESYLI